jgi:hypothetical protein
MSTWPTAISCRSSSSDSALRFSDVFSATVVRLSGCA